MHGVPVGRLVNVANRMPTTSSARLLHEFAVIALDKAFSLMANESYIGSFFFFYREVRTIPIPSNIVQ